MDGAASSQDLHPKTGGRFVFTREPGEQLNYRVTAYLPQGREVQAELSWCEGQAVLELGPATPEPIGDELLSWVREHMLKLARVLRRTPKQRLVRWRG